MTPLALRLHPGQDLLTELTKMVNTRNIDAACILTCVGSLTSAVLRFANQEEPTTLTGHFEIVSLTGVLSKKGVHCHIAIADEQGKTYGAHLMAGCKIYTTAEIVICIIPHYSFDRTFDPDTGYPELEVIYSPHKEE